MQPDGRLGPSALEGEPSLADMGNLLMVNHVELPLLRVGDIIDGSLVFRYIAVNFTFHAQRITAIV